MFAGDRGNDVAALVSGVASVAVANADAETQRAVSREALANNTAGNTYQARGGLKLADNRVLNGNYAAGIVEELTHHQPAWRSHLLDAQWIAESVSALKKTSNIKRLEAQITSISFVCLNSARVMRFANVGANTVSS